MRRLLPIRRFAVLTTVVLAFGCSGSSDKAAGTDTGGTPSADATDGVDGFDSSVDTIGGTDVDTEVPDSSGEDITDTSVVPTGPAKLVINEIVAEQPGQADWVELYNAGGEPQSLAGWSVGRASGIKGILPAVTIEAGGYYVAESALIFDLQAEDAIRLTSKTGELIDEAEWQAGDAAPGSSWGRFPNGVGPFKTLATLTKGAPNVDEGISPCGNATCDADESCVNCPGDCTACPSCDDTTCNGDETCTTCPGDCGVCPTCGNGDCGMDEDCLLCEADCGKCADGCGATLFFGAYLEGSSQNKAIEIVNYTGQAVDLSTYAIWRISNGGPWSEGEANDTPLEGVLPHGGSLVLCNSNAGSDIQALCDIVGGNAVTFNGDDALGLALNGELVDTVGDDSDPAPSNGWDVNGIPAATSDHTLIRKSSIATGNTNWAVASQSEWQVFDMDVLDTFGKHKAVGKCAPVTPGAQVALNEVATAGTDYVELHNLDSLNSVDISGWTIAIGAATHTFPSGTTIGAEGFAAFTELGDLPTEGGLLTLSDATPKVMDSTNVPAGLADTETTGRIPDGTGVWKTLEVATMGAANKDNVIICGDSVCDSSESCSSCAKDCGICPKCGDKICSVTESCSTCAADCGQCAECGDTVCVQKEDCGSCELDCGVCATGCAADLFFSEYIEGTGYNKGLEIANRTTAPIDLAGYSVWRITNGGAWTEGKSNGQVLSGVLYPGEVFTLCDKRGAGFLAPCDLGIQSGPVLFNGNDALALVKGATIIDVVGTDGADPGYGWEVGGVPSATMDHTLRRKDSVNAGNADWSVSSVSEWVVLPMDTFEGFGSHSQATDCSPTVGCGDTFCDTANGEACDSCESDCGVCPDICGNGNCGNGETCSNCATDCGVCPEVCGNGTCGGTETCTTCEADCGVCPDICGNGTCAPGETCTSCESDCGVCPEVCGNGTCGEGETCTLCPEDCGECPDICGNGTCGVGETCTTCEADCGVCPDPCGNGTCAPSETCGSCPADCGPCASTCSSGLFFSEYVEGASNTKALELYNDTGATVTLSDYSIAVGSNGAAVQASTATALTGTLAPGKTYVICHSSSVAAVKAKCDKQILGGIVGFNGNDAVVLFLGQTIVDTIGEAKVDPGAGWTVGTTAKATLDHTLRRVASQEEPISDWATASGTWEVLPLGTFDGLGSHTVNAPCVVP